jgi:predicted dehydrogenase
MVMNAIKMSKHVLVDKPMAINLKEADEMINEARKKA